MSGAKYAGSWRAISSIQHKTDGSWVEHSHIYARTENAWHEVDLDAEPLGPAYHTWVIYAVDPYATTFEGKGISTITLGTSYVGIRTGNRTNTPVIGVDIVDNDDLVGFEWSTLGGQDSTLIYISPLDGTAIKNGVGQLRLRVRQVSGTQDLVITEDPSAPLADPQLYVGGVAKGREPTFSAADIDESLVVELRNAGDILDTISLIDVTDGGEVVQVGFDVDNGLSWVKAANDGAWVPSTTNTTMTFTWYQSGAAIAQRTATLTLEPATGHILCTSDYVSGDDSTVSFYGAGTSRATVLATHTLSNVSMAENVVSVRGGDEGAQGDDAILVTVTSNNGHAFKNNLGAAKTITANVFIGGAESADYSEYLYTWTVNNSPVYATTSGTYAGTEQTFQTYLADGDDVSGVNLRSIEITATDVASGLNFNLSCVVSNI